MNTVEPYSDYKFWYQGFAEQFLYDDWLPYMQQIEDPSKYKNILEYILNIIIGNRNLNFIYPPFFFYSIIIPSLISIDLVFLPLLLANLLLPFVIYKFLDNIYGKNVAEWGFMATALSPISIFYNGGLLLNTSYITLFFTIALYFTSINRFSLATVFLSISILFKQTVVFFVLPFLVYVTLQYWKNKNDKKIISYFKGFIKYSGIIFVITFLGSLPWIIINPKNYIESLLAEQSITFNPEFSDLAYNFPVQWYSFLIRLGAPYWLLYILGFLTFTYIGIMLIEIIVVLLLYKCYKKNTLNIIKFLDVIVYTAFLTHLFFPRGVYKYYFTFHIPLIILWLCFHFNDIISSDRSKGSKWMLIFILVSLVIIVIPRLYYLIIIWGIIVLIIRTNLNLRREQISLEINNSSIS
ncbi:MAG: hypothetical protein JSV23_03990 [Promethearchaeota archaeon]|nr:MAG: hypothetical protein JSV23_03990 [Candidatus Lokiarchaeota archaeon]